MSDTGTKPWWQSRTVWASLVQILVAILVGAGKLTPDGAELLHGGGADVIVGVITAVLAAVALHGRVQATHRVG